MEIKILCPCGAKFKFDVQPVNGQSPGAVRCPSCGADSTAATNALIAQQLAASVPALGAADTAPAPAAAPRISVSPAPPAATSDPKPAGSPKMAFMPAPAAGTGSALSVAGHSKPEATPMQTGAPPPAPAPIAAHPATGKFTSSLPESARGEGRLGMGVTGAVIGCLVGAGIWYFLAVNVVEGWRILAWIPGIIGGLGAILFARRPSEKLGLAAAVVAGIITILTQFAVIAGINDKRLTEASETNYTEMMALAKKAVDAKSDPQVKELMEEDPEYGGSFRATTLKEALREIAAKVEKAEREEAAREAGTAPAGEADELAEYRKKRLPELIKFSKGEPSRTRYIEQQRARLEEEGYLLYRKKWFWMGVWIVSSIQSAYAFGRGKKKG